MADPRPGWAPAAPSLEEVTPDNAASFVPPADGIPGVTPMTFDPPDPVATMADLPPLSDAVAGYVSGLAARVYGEDFDDAVDAVGEALAQVGVTIVDGAGTVTRPPNPAAIDVTFELAELPALALTTRQSPGADLPTVAGWLRTAGWTLPPEAPATDDYASLLLRLQLAMWMGTGYGFPDELEINFVPQFLLAASRLRGQDDAWILHSDSPTNATIDTLGRQLLAYGVQQALSPVGPVGTGVPTRTMGDSE